ncbi:MAG: cell wall synthesis protein CwsA [Mycobacterium sp.]|uniref:cell wall synthesis protein CwsA n=1 Tax=Mycobacterium sp. TaxID=1785 RepID=UPI00262973DC|nr:cell wall synthesis protein CwsA [Mycobacterium sp.]MDI3313234.1 cell wall synthesis protein CwsA [Mycobacterium sp.]
MGAKAVPRMTPRQRLTRGLTYTAVGPVDVTRGVVGLGVRSTRAGAATVWRRYRQARLARERAATQEPTPSEPAAARGAVIGLPRLLPQPGRFRRRGRHRWAIVAVAGMLLAGGAVAVIGVRRSARPEPSPRPPSVDVQPTP